MVARFVHLVDFQLVDDIMYRVFTSKEVIDYVDKYVRDLYRPSEKLIISGVRITRDKEYTLIVLSDTKVFSHETGEMVNMIYNYTQWQAFDRLVFTDGKPFKKLKEIEGEREIKNGNIFERIRRFINGRSKAKST
jgi:hypothetical protein